MLDPQQLTVSHSPLQDICYNLGGIHKAIQILDMLHPETALFAILPGAKSQTIKPTDVMQYKFTGEGAKKLYGHGANWQSVDECSLPGRTYFELQDFIKQLEHSICHCVYVPENVYFQSIDKINRLK